MKDKTITKTWAKYQQVVDFKKRIKLITKIYHNEKFYSGDQWYELAGKTGDLPLVVMNICAQLADLKQAQVLGNDLNFILTPEDYTTEDEEDENGELNKAYKAFNNFSEQLQEDCNQKLLNTKTIARAKITGGGGTFFYWDYNVKKGNKVRAIGDVRAMSIDSSSYYPADPYNNDVQSQDWIIISGRESVKKLRAEAKASKVEKENIDKIVADEETENEGFEYNRIAETRGRKATTLLMLWKDPKTGTVHYCKSTKNVIIKKDVDTGLEIYPIAWMNWKNKEGSAFGMGEIEAIIPAQVSINKLLSFAIRSVGLTGFPKLLVNRQFVAGGVSNDIGGIIEMIADGDVRQGISYLQPPSSSAELYRLIDTLVDMTRSINGANDAALGESPAQNASAIIALQKQSEIPLKNTQNNYEQYLEQVGTIYVEFFKKLYTQQRGVVVEDSITKTSSLEKYRGSDFADVKFKVKVDVGTGARYSQVMVMQELEKYKAEGDITFEQYLEYVPKEVMPRKEKILEDIRQNNKLKEAEDALIDAVMQSLAPEESQELQAMAEQDENGFRAEMLNRAMEMIAPPQAMPTAEMGAPTAPPSLGMGAPTAPIQGGIV